MEFIIRKHGLGFAPNMSVCNSDGNRQFLVKGRWFNLPRTRYWLRDDAGETLLEIIQDHSADGTLYSIYENNIRIGSAGTNAPCTCGTINIEGIGHARMLFGHEIGVPYSLTTEHGVLAEITATTGLPPEWSIRTVKECNHVHLIAGLAVIYGEYLKEVMEGDGSGD